MLKKEKEVVVEEEYFFEKDSTIKLRKGAVEEVVVLEEEHFFEKDSTIKLRKGAVKFIYITYGLVLAFTMTVIMFQGFTYKDFKLPDAFLHWLGGATVGEVAGLAFLAFKFLFSRDK